MNEIDKFMDDMRVRTEPMLEAYAQELATQFAAAWVTLRKRHFTGTIEAGEGGYIRLELTHPALREGTTFEIASNDPEPILEMLQRIAGGRLTEAIDEDSAALIIEWERNNNETGL